MGAQAQFIRCERCTERWWYGRVERTHSRPAGGPVGYIASIWRPGQCLGVSWVRVGRVSRVGRATSPKFVEYFGAAARRPPGLPEADPARAPSVPIPCPQPLGTSGTPTFHLFTTGQELTCRTSFRGVWSEGSGIWVGWSVEVFGRAAPSRAAPVVTSVRSCRDRFSPSCKSWDMATLNALRRLPRRRT